MKKTALLNQPLSALIAGLGHTDCIVVTDAGLSIPTTVQRIDLAVSAGVPSLLDVLRAILSEMQISNAIIASELPEHSPQFYSALLPLLNGIAISEVPHNDFVLLTYKARAAVRTGEFIPFANVILVSEVIF
ncbi:MAG TPA: D-ribose pyranase [Phototrophicaceae bacterium]|nr:D-ribose pyranase [Phototrophicaceae bacterium]